MPTYDAGTTGLTGTVRVAIYDLSGSVVAAATTSGITEIGSTGVYHVAEHDASLDLIYAWDNGAGTIGASETLYAGREDTATGTALAVVDGTVDDILVDTALLEKHAINELRQTKNEDGTVTVELMDDDDVTVLKTWVYDPSTKTRSRAE